MKNVTTDASLAADTLNTLDSNTTGTNADTVNTSLVPQQTFNNAYDSDGISNLGDENITLTDASPAANTQHARQQHHRHRQRRHRQHLRRNRPQHRLRPRRHQQPR